MSDRDLRLLWQDMRLAVLDIETVWDPGGFGGSARDETDRAIQAVRATGQPVRLASQPRKVRWQQHATVEAAGLTSMSHGQEPDRAVEVRPGCGAAPVQAAANSAQIGGEFRVASVAVCECVRGKAGEPWHTLVNPGVPVDPETGKRHKLTDEQLRSAPPFAAIADELLRRLTPANGEVLVLAGHNVGYDVGVLRGEMRRIGKAQPDLPVLDTIGPLAARVGHRSGLALLDLLAELGLPEPRPHHSAPEDARATAAAACHMLGLAAEDGTYDMTTLIEELGGQRMSTVGYSWSGARTTKPGRPARTIPEDHQLAHFPLPPAPNADEIARWASVADECAAHRCPDLADVAGSVVARSLAALPAGEPQADLVLALVCVAESRAAAGDGPGTATILDAIGLAFDLACPVPLPGDKVRYPIERQPAIDLWHRLRVLRDGLPRCSLADACPRCWDGRSCGTDELPFRLAPAIAKPRWSGGRMETLNSINHWLAAEGNQGWFVHRHDRKRRGGAVKGAFAGPELADAALGWMLRTFRSHGDSAEPDKVIAYQVQRVLTAGGCSDPAFWELVALDFARSGREQDLAQALAACDEGLRTKPVETTASAWRSLVQTSELMRLRLARAQRGHEIRHHPGPAAQRKRVMRFA